MFTWSIEVVSKEKSDDWIEVTADIMRYALAVSSSPFDCARL